jgi:endonuclease YncB( thermonuclease family)
VQGQLRSESPAGDRVMPAASDEVERVVDGDTVVLISAGKSRLIGVDTPEVFGGHERFRELARQARERGAGLWSSRSCDGDPDRPAG